MNRIIATILPTVLAATTQLACAANAIDDSRRDVAYHRAKVGGTTAAVRQAAR